jgi:hypothetical protein
MWERIVRRPSVEARIEHTDDARRSIARSSEPCRHDVAAPARDDSVPMRFPASTRVRPSSTPAPVVQRAAGGRIRRSTSAPSTGRRAGTALPDDVRTGIAQLSGFSMDDITVHYDSPQPARVDALAYAHGRDIHLAPGQEQHLAHEAWHLVQQAQGRVRPTIDVAGMGVNDDARLEREAEAMGRRAVQDGGRDNVADAGQIPPARPSGPIQRVKVILKYNPLHPKHREEKEVETKDFTLIQKLDVLTSQINKTYQSSESFQQLVADVLAASATAWRTLIATKPQMFKLFCNAYQKAGAEGYAKPAQDIARDFLDHVPPDAPAHATFTARQILPKDEAEKVDLTGAFEKSKQESAAKEAVAKGSVRKFALQFLQIASLFADEIPVEFAALRDARDEFKARLDRAEDEFTAALSQKPSAEADKLVRDAIKEVQTQADLIVRFVNNFTPSRRVPTSFEETLHPEYVGQIEDVRAVLDKLLAPAVSRVQSLIPGAAIKYRGSLTDAIKNFTKSTPVERQKPATAAYADFEKRAVPVNLKAFDVDAFIEVPDATWEGWESAGLIPAKKDMPIKGKMLLDKWIPLLSAASEKDTGVAAKAALAQVLALKEVETELQKALSKVAGYKTTGETHEAEFELVVQPGKKTRKEVTYGKPYPLGELSQSGSAYEELTARWGKLREHALDVEAAWLSEEQAEAGGRKGTRLQQRAAKERSVAYGALEKMDLSGASLKESDVQTLFWAIAQGSLPKLKHLVLPGTTKTAAVAESLPKGVVVEFAGV